VVFRIAAPRIDESSSLVHSTVHPGLFYTANDSGDGPVVYVLDSSGRLVGTTTLQGVDPVDVEAMAAGSDGSLVVGDIGDNAASRPNVQIYRIVQPGAGGTTVLSEKVTLKYADGAHNAEAMVYDADTGRVFVVTKEPFGTVYASPPDVFSLSTATLRPIAGGPTIATDATFLPGQRAVVVRTYEHAYVYSYPSWRLVTSFPLPPEKQGESITAVGTRSVWVGSEGADSPVWAVPLPARVTRWAVTPTPPQPTAPWYSVPPTGHPIASGAGGGASSDSSGDPTVVTVSTSAGIVVVAVGAVVMFSHRRQRPDPESTNHPTHPPDGEESRTPRAG
jgi:hypothetical protein